MKHWHQNRRLGLNLSRVLGNTNTDGHLAAQLVAAFVPLEGLTSASRFLEPAVGAGAFYFSLVDRLLGEGFPIEHIVESMVDACDVDPSALTILRAEIERRYSYRCTGRERIFQIDFLCNNLLKGGYDAVATNPPYVSIKNIKDPAGGPKNDYLAAVRDSIDPEIDPRSDLYVYFMAKSLNLLKEGGKCIFLCSDSWIDAQFGAYVWRRHLTGDSRFELMLNSQISPFFRDDTNAILTVATKGPSVQPMRIANLRKELGCPAEEVKFTDLSHAELEAIVHDETIPNKRNALILFGDVYGDVKQRLERHDCLVRLEDLASISSTPFSHATMLKNGWIKENERTSVPVFWQIQARVNRPQKYQNFLEPVDLSYELAVSCPADVIDKNVHSGNVYLSTIIDRFPLVFFTDGPSAHVSKYFSLTPRKGFGQTELTVALNSIWACSSYELTLKEGTRKTLRTGECGLAKEIKINDLRRCLIPMGFTLSEVDSVVKSYHGTIVSSIEDAILNDDYWAIQLHIASQNGLIGDMEWTLRGLIFLYVLRMRNVEKLKKFDSYFNEVYGHRLASIQETMKSAA